MVRSWCKISLTSIVVVLAYLSLFRGGFDQIADDPGLGWHLADGALIASTARVPDVDPFLAPALLPNPYAPVGTPRKWVSEQWLSDVILYKLYAVGGWPLLYGFVAGLFLIAYFGVAFDGLTKSGQGSLLVILATILGFKLGQVHLIIRPVIFSLLLFPLVLRRVNGLMRRVDISWKQWRHEALVLSALFALWANLHPAFVYGLCVIGLAVLSEITRGRAGRSPAVRWATIGVLCFCATMCNPYGPALYESIGQLGGSSYLRSLTMEWYPTDLGRPEGELLMILAGVPLLCVVALPAIRKRVAAFDILVALFFVVQALWAVRALPFASFACLPLWAACFCEGPIIPSRGVFALTSRALSVLGEREQRSYLGGLASSTVVAVVGAIIIAASPERVLPSQVGSAHERQLKQLFTEVDTTGNERVVFASLNWGGSITHLLGPRYKPVVDDRTVVVGEELYRASLESFMQPSKFEDIAETFGVTDVLVPSTQELAVFLRQQPRWRELSSVEGNSLFSRP